MSKIHLLDNNLIDKIAAGEVVERPASVVKELLENSIDAGATSLTVEIHDGGISYIRISDNGKGIPRDQIRTAFMRHATSKLNVFEDLEDILTLGFRGEALSSIASVADVEMITRTVDDAEGTKIELSGGKVIDEMPSAAEVGTIFTVKNLFYNTPARRKFLKKPATEGSYVADVVNRIALGHPHIALKYINNGNTILQTSGNGDLKTTVFHIYGKEHASKMTAVKLARDGYGIEGLTARPELSRANRSYETFFINGRYVKSGVVANAAEEAYKGRLMTGKFPVYVLNLTVPKNTVDVNVHPTKLEVRFSDEGFIYELVYDAITKALKGEELIPDVTWDKSKNNKAQETKDITEDKPILNPELVSAPKPTQAAIELDTVKPNGNGTNELDSVPKGEALVFSDYDVAKERRLSFNDIVSKVYGNSDTAKAEQIKPSEPKVTETTAAETEPKSESKAEIKSDTTVKRSFFSHYKLIGQLFNTYWIIEQDDKMYMIDQHAAHERVLYEELTKRALDGESVSQMLLQPIAVNLTESEKNVLEENRTLLESFGYIIEELGPNACAIRAVPCVFNEPSSASFFLDIIDTLRDKSIKSIYETKSDAIATMSCKAAVKGNDKLSFAEARTLIERMLSLDNPFSCPHGRPTIIEMSRYELEKKFKRIV
jgi:DNA mismatch repair protein MutL